MPIKDSDNEEINWITSKSEVREQAFFTIMRQSGLSPKTIQKLKIKDIDLSSKSPCRIELGAKPAFIGEEAKNYTNLYLNTRRNKTPECFLFTLQKENKEINTKNISTAFRRLAEEYEKSRIINSEKKLHLFDLVKFFRKNAKLYLKELKNSPQENEDFFRKQYELKAQPYLEIETLTAREKEIGQHKEEIKKLNERLERIENLFFPRWRPVRRKVQSWEKEAERIKKWIQKHPEQAEEEERWYDEQVSEAEEIEKLMMKDSWKWACYIQQTLRKISIYEQLLKQEQAEKAKNKN